MAPRCRTLLTTGLLLALCACSLMPRELNLTPLWFHRLDQDGHMLECDFLWPIVHYEQTTAGGDDFRIRPLYRRVTETAEENLGGDGPAVEHQFLWPLGRIRSDAAESSHRVFPLWSWRGRVNDEGERDVDWYALFPIFWGGHSQDGREDYFAVFPLYADIPQFLSYDRFFAFLFPLYLRLDKEGHRHHMALWPLVGWSSCAENGHRRFHFYPFYGHDIEPGDHDRRFLLWPFIAWSTENEFTDDPVKSYWFWPLCGFRIAREAGGWMALWPFFSSSWKQEHFAVLTLFWPFFHYYWNKAEDNVTSWWLWPFYSRTKSDDQDSWTALWPLIWWRRYDDPDGRTEQQWVLPFYWHVAITGEDGSSEQHTKVWPFWHHTEKRDAEGAVTTTDWSLLSPLFMRGDSARGIEEAYGPLWEVAVGRQRRPGDRAVDLVGRLYTERERDGESTWSVPFLCSGERARDGARTLRLFQFLPIPLGGASSPEEKQ